MKKAVVLAALCGVLGLSSCCRIMDCCFEDPCAVKKERSHHESDCGYKPACGKNACGSSDCQSKGPKAQPLNQAHGSCRQ